MSRALLSPESVASALATGWEQALAAASDPPEEVSLRVADRSVEVRVLGEPPLRDLLRSLEHLSVPELGDDGPDLSIDVWFDRDVVPALRPRLPDDGSAPFRPSADGRFVEYHLPDHVAALDRGSHRLVVAFDDEPSLDSLGRPFSRPLRLWLTDRHVQILHAGMVARDGRGVLFGGPGGSGKSTSALACLRAGFDFLGEDVVGVTSHDDVGPVGHSLFASCHLEPDHLRATFPDIPDPITRPDEDKDLVFPAPSGSLARSAPISALVLPRVSRSSRTCFTPADKGPALLRLAPSSIMPAPRSHRDGLESIARVVEAVSCWWLDLGDDPADIAPRIDDILSRSRDE